MKFLWGLLLGFALGVAAGLLLAPQSGEATRAQIGEQGIMLRDRSGSLTGDLRARATNLTGEVRARANDAMEQGREIYSRTKDDLSSRYTRAKSGDL
jgi:gas vesicle protein